MDRPEYVTEVPVELIESFVSTGQMVTELPDGYRLFQEVKVGDVLQPNRELRVASDLA